ncbi:MAG: NfeD family protein [Clostridia bacterium]|nr:NfeD family protein [Clostridia bacterium]
MAAVFGTLWVPCLVLSILGIAFLIAELFLPGFGVSGICGVLCLIAVCVIQFLTAKPLAAILVTAVLGLILIAMLIVFMRSMKRGVLFRSPIVLKERIEADAVKPSTGTLEHLLGKTGTAITPLRPSGIALIDGQRYSVESQATFIDKDSEITVLSVDGTKITVR